MSISCKIKQQLQSSRAPVTLHLSINQAYFIFYHLEGEAKDKIRYRPRVEREDPQKSLPILRELHGCSKSYYVLQEKFFGRKQLEGESLQEYSHDLFAFMNKSK